ncbi:hypothetical protein M422DRAFT_54536 [Sphaerobolus stellatus SS14]|uniref:Unplaced genomic scaffold SPHSTscaffold_226, whole genome shotgun sequence n=1 Tax=Sphaerobolus stellatus (strain SS14) TaxID=990650 RepID=A0A0C9TGU5_SPHS4|nr:hypothetical protein M422DRAFT_54536 [Sphaerobolus stellatus SS14]
MSDNTGEILPSTRDEDQVVLDIVDVAYCPDCCNHFPRKTISGPCTFCKKLASETAESTHTEMQSWPRCEDCGVGGPNLPAGDPRLCGLCKKARKVVDPQAARVAQSAAEARQIAVDHRLRRDHGTAPSQRATLSHIVPTGASAPTADALRSMLSASKPTQRTIYVILEPHVKATMDTLFGLTARSYTEETSMDGMFCCLFIGYFL